MCTKHFAPYQRTLLERNFHELNCLWAIGFKLNEVKKKNEIHISTERRVLWNIILYYNLIGHPFPCEVVKYTQTHTHTPKFSNIRVRFSKLMAISYKASHSFLLIAFLLLYLSYSLNSFYLCFYGFLVFRCAQNFIFTSAVKLFIVSYAAVFRSKYLKTRPTTEIITIFLWIGVQKTGILSLKIKSPSILRYDSFYSVFTFCYHSKWCKRGTWATVGVFSFNFCW